MKRYFYSEEFVDGGEAKGPVTIQRLRELRFENEITDLCKVCAEEEGEGNWMNLAELLRDGMAVAQAAKSVEQAVEQANADQRDVLAKEQRQKELREIRRNIQTSIDVTKGNLASHPDKGNWVIGIYAIVGLIFVCWGLYKYSESRWDIPKAAHDMGKAVETPSDSNVWASRDIVSIEEIKTDASLNPIIGFGAGKNGRAKPMVGALPQSGKIQWKVTWRDSSGVLRSQVVNKRPSRF